MDLDHADELLESFLTLARAQDGQLGDKDRVALEPLITSAFTDRADQIVGKRLTIETHLGALEVIGSPTLLRRMLENVIENAVRHNQPGGTVEIAISALDGRQARVVIDSSGPVLDQDSVAQLAQPFKRLSRDRTGHKTGTDSGSRSSLRSPPHTTASSISTPAPKAGCVCRSRFQPSPSRSSRRPQDEGSSLVVEDIPRHANRIAEGLRDQGIAVDVAYDGHEAIAKVNLNPYDVVLLDRDLPGIHGDMLCQIITRSEDPPMVLMLTAAGAPADRVKGLALGADDYLPKPFHFPELVLRVHALARRKPAAGPPTLQAGGIELDPRTGTVTRDGRTIELSRKERAVLQALLKASPGALSTERLLEQAWDENADPFTNVVKVTIARLRGKLGQPGIIHTTSGVGYRITEAP